MKIRKILRLYRIAMTLARHGFGHVAASIRIFPFFTRVLRVVFFRRAGVRRSVAVRIRLVLEELGPMFVKLGQLVSTRADLLPPDWLFELKKLQDMVPPVPFDEVRKVVENSFGRPLDKIFLTFDETPIAAASVAQVHFATLFDSTEVAVKIKRPGIDRSIETDILVMYSIADLLTRYVPASARYRLSEVVDEFSRDVHKELDLTVEGSAASVFARIFKSDPQIKIPGVYWDLSSRDVLTMERIKGTPIDEVDELRARGLDVEKIAVKVLQAFFKQVFNYGVFHADLHPGNIFAGDDGTIIYLDFGIVGRLDRKLRHYLASILFHLVRKDYAKMAVIHREMNLIGKHVDLEEFEDAVRDITEPVFGRASGDINISMFIMKLIETARRFDMQLQPHLLLLQKTMVVLEGVVRELYPGINMWEVAKPLVYKWMVKEKLSPGPIYDKTREFVLEFGETVFDLPGQFHQLLGKTSRDELKIGFVHHGTESIEGALKSAGGRIAAGLIISALLIGSSLITVLSPADTRLLFGIPAPGAVGFFISFLFALRFFLWPGSKY